MLLWDSPGQTAKLFFQAFDLALRCFALLAIHIRGNRAFTVAYHVGDMIDAFRTVEKLADSPDHIIPGHDPLVMKLYPAASPALENIVIRLDGDPKKLG